MTGVNKNFSKGHSSRLYASVIADLSGSSAIDILNMRSWSNISSWQIFYNKPGNFKHPSKEKVELLEQRMEFRVPVCLPVATEVTSIRCAEIL